MVAPQVSVEWVESYPIPQDGGGKLHFVLCDRHRPQAQHCRQRITRFLPCTVPQAFSSSLYLECGTRELQRPWSAGFCGSAQVCGKNSPGAKNPHNSHYVPFFSTLMLLSLTWLLLCIACTLKTNKHETGHCCTQFSALEGNENKPSPHINYAITSPIARVPPSVQLGTRRVKPVTFSVLQALTPAKQPPATQIQSNRLKSS